MKRIISIVLALIMTVTALPLNVFAEDDLATTIDQILIPELSDELISDPIPEKSTEEPISDPVVESDTDVELEPDDEMVTVPEIPLDPIIDSEISNELVPDSAPTTEPSLDVDDICIGSFIEEVTQPVLYSSIIASGTCGDNLTWTLTDDGTLTISGTGEMYSYRYLDAPWYSYCSSIVSVDIGNGVTSIGSSAFSECSNLKRITIPEGLIYINQSAFFCCSSLEEITIPKSVTYIGNSAFYGCSSLEIVTIIEGTTIIDNYAFSDCKCLRKIILPESSLVKIGDRAFYGCVDLETVVIPGSVKTLGEGAFFGCTSLTSVTISEGVTSTGYYAFFGCTNLKCVSLPNSLQEISDESFKNCSNLVDISIPEGVTYVGYSAFSGCSSLESIKIPSQITHISDYSFFGCEKLSDILISDAVTVIGESAFASCSSLLNIELPANIISVGDYAFSRCTSLEDVSNLEGVISIGDGAFYECKNLQSVIIPESVINLGDGVFYHCESLSSVVIPKQIKTLDNTFFIGCMNLEHIYFMSSTVEINYFPSFMSCTIHGYKGSTAQMFAEKYRIEFNIICDGQDHGFVVWKKYDDVQHVRYCEDETCGTYEYADHIWNGEITTEPSCFADGLMTYSCTDCDATKTESIPATGEHEWYIWQDYDDTYHTCICYYSVFGDCTGNELQAHEYDAENEYSCTLCGHIKTGDDIIVSGKCGYNASFVLLIDGTLIIFGSGSVYSEEWNDYIDIITNIIVKEGITEIGFNAFEGCLNLSTVTLPESLEVIGSRAFFHCTSLNSIEIPECVTSIGASAFYSCSSLTSITIPKSVTSIGNTAFSNCSSLTSITIPESVENIGDNCFSECANLTKINVSDSNKYYADFDGVLFNKSITRLILYPLGKFDSVYSIPESVTTVDAYAFYDNKNLVKLTIPDNVIHIGWSAFEGCEKLNEVSISNNIAKIDGYVFANCTSLSEINIPEGAKSIENHAFYNCSNLTSVIIPESVTYIGEYVFMNCISLTNIVIPINVTSIASDAFYNSKSLASITLLNPETTIYDSTNTISYTATIYGHAGSTAEEYARKYYRGFVPFCDGINHFYGDWSKYDDTYHVRYCQDYNCNAEDYEEHVLSDWREDFDSHVCSCIVSKCIHEVSYDHNWVESEVLSEPTCSRDGEMYYRCSDCTAAKIEPIPATGEHVYGNWVQLNDIEHISYCTDCVVSCTEPHVFGNKFDHICDICGYYADVEGLIAHGTCGEHLYWELSTDGTLTINGFGAMTDFEWATKAPWFNYADEIVSVKIQDGVTSIGVYAFLNCFNLLQADLPNSILSIGEAAFENCNSLDYINLPENLISIGSEAFRYCTGFTQITIPESVKSIGFFAFANCNGITTIIIPENVESIGQYAFYSCTKLTDATVNSKTLISGIYVFRDCTSLKNVAINGEDITLGSHTFYGCTNLETVTLKGVTSIGESAFYQCTNLLTVYMEDVITIGAQAFSSCNSLVNLTLSDNLVEIGNRAFYDTDIEYLDVPDSVESIGDSAFTLCLKLKQISLPANLKHLGEYAFKFSGLTSITIPVGVTSIGSNTFSYSEKLVSVEILGNVTSIGDHAFDNCINLRTVNIPDSVEYIGEYAFSDCDMLESVNIPEGVTSIGAYTFYDCYRLQDVTIPASVQSIGEKAFDSSGKVTILNPNVEIFDDWWTIRAATIYGYTGSTAQTYAEKHGKRFVALDAVVPIPPSDDHIMSGMCGENLIWILYNNGNLVISGEGEMTDFAWSPWYDYLDVIKTVTISEGVTSIGDKAFYFCMNLTSVNIPSTVTRIGENAFYYCTSLTYIDIPAAVTQIGAGAFVSCDGLNTLRIPENVTSIGENALDNCSLLSLVTFYNPNIEISSSLGLSSYNATVLGYTGSTAQAYAENNGIKFIALDSTKVIASGTCGEKLTWKLFESGVLSISGTGEMSERPSWSSYSSKIYSVVISEGVSSIGERVFWYCSNISSITIPSTVTRISNQAFAGCSNLSSIVIPESVINIGEGAFSECDNLREIYIPKSVKYIGAGAFDFCTNLISFEVADDNEYYCDVEGVLFSIDKTSLVSYPSGRTNADYAIPDGVTTINKYSFAGCKYLSNVTVPESMSKIDANAFMYCTSLEFVEIPDGITKIDDYAFFDCKNLTDICLPETLISIGNSAFSGCLSLTSITIPESVTSIGRYAFLGCDSLESITIMPIYISIYNESLTISKTATIHGYYDSTAHSYALEFDREFVPLNDDPDEIDPELIVNSGKCGENLEWSLTAAGRLIISGTGEMEDYGLLYVNGEYIYKMVPWDYNTVYTIILSEGITSIGANALLLAGQEINELHIPASVSTVGNQSLPSFVKKLTVAEDSDYFTVVDGVLFTKDMSEVVLYPSSKTDKSYSIPDTVKTIRSNAFSNTMELEYLYIPSSVSKIETGIYGGKLKAISVDDDSKYYRDVNGIVYDKWFTEFVAFPYESLMTNLVLPNTVTTMNESISGKNLKNITIPENVSYFSGLGNCPNLETLTFLSKTITISDYIFIPDNIKIIGYEDSTAEKFVSNNQNSNLEFVAIKGNYLRPSIEEYIEVPLGTAINSNQQVVTFDLGRTLKQGDSIVVHFIGSSADEFHYSLSSTVWPDYSESYRVTESKFNIHAEITAKEDGVCYIQFREPMWGQGLKELNITYCGVFFGTMDEYDSICNYINSDIIDSGESEDGYEWQLSKDGTLAVDGSGDIVCDEIATITYLIDVSDAYADNAIPSYFELLLPDISEVVFGLTEYTVEINNVECDEDNGVYRVFFESTKSDADSKKKFSVIPDLTDNNKVITVVVSGKISPNTPSVFARRMSIDNYSITFFNENDEETFVIDSSVQQLIPEIEYETATPWGENAESIKEIELNEEIISVSKDVFSDLTNLESITFRNTETEIFDDEETIPSSTVIYGYAGSTAEAYANKYGRAFVDISFKQGDLDDNGIVDNNDAIYLLYYTIFGEDEYPINQDCDFDGSGTVDNNDAIYLLYHTIFGAHEYPLL